MEIKELPKNEDAERNLIGLCLIEGRIPLAARDLKTTDFFSPNCRSAWSAFLELQENGQEIDPISAAHIIKRNGINFSVSELSQTMVGMLRINPKTFIEKIRDASTRRYLMRELCALIENVQSGKGSISDFKSKFADIENTSLSKGSFRLLGDILERDVKPALYDLGKGITHRISTGFNSIDTILGGGLSLSDVVAVASVTSGGKSTFVLQLAANIAKQNIPVAFVSGEMSDKENGFRLVSQEAKFMNLNSAMHLDNEEIKYLETWIEALKPLPIYFDSVTSDIQTLARSLRSLVEETGVKVLIIDYLQLFKYSKTDKPNRTERIAEVSQEVKRLAMEFGIAVVEVVQFNREGSKSLKSQMYDLDGSSQLEKDASLIFIIDREENSNNVTLRIVKGRNVGKCEINGTFNGMTLRFEF